MARMNKVVVPLSSNQHDLKLRNGNKTLLKRFSEYILLGDKKVSAAIFAGERRSYLITCCKICEYSAHGIPWLVVPTFL